MKLLFNPTVEDRTWNVDLERDEVRNRVVAWLSQQSPRYVSATESQIIVTIGSRFLTRMIGGAFSPARWVPLAALIEMNPQGRSGTRVLVRLADNLGVTFRKGAWTKLVRRRFDQVYAGLDELWKV